MSYFYLFNLSSLIFWWLAAATLVFVFHVVFLLFVVAIDVAVHAHLLAIVWSVCVWTCRGVACCPSAVHMIAVITHALCIMRRCCVRTFGNSQFGPATFSRSRSPLTALFFLSYLFAHCFSLLFFNTLLLHFLCRIFLRSRFGSFVYFLFFGACRFMSQSNKFLCVLSEKHGWV